MSGNEDCFITKLIRHEDIYSAIDNLRNDIYDQTYNDTEQLKKLSKKYSLYANVLVIKQNNHVAGICVFYDNDFVSKTAFLSMIVVNKFAQGRGYGHALLNEMTKMCREQGMEKIRLEVKNSNIKAFHFYENIGYCLERTEEDKSTYTISL